MSLIEEIFHWLQVEININFRDEFAWNNNSKFFCSEVYTVRRLCDLHSNKSYFAYFTPNDFSLLANILKKG